MSDALVIENLNKQQGDFSIKDFELVLPAKCVMGLAGNTGAGKSTIVKMIMGLEKPDSGTIKVFGYDTVKEMKKVRSITGIATEDGFFPPFMTAAEIGAVLRPLYPEWNSDMFTYLLRRMNVAQAAKIENMSGDETVKLNIAAALSHNTRLLIIDDILGELSGAAIKEITDVLHEYVYDYEGSLLISSHFLGDFEQLCDYFAFMQDGELKFFDLKENLLGQYASIERRVDLSEIMLYLNRKEKHSSKGNMKNKNLRKKSTGSGAKKKGKK
ncbi:MAG: ABC transporter ATP-binding protein [Eubacteriaceae bacterium]|jgi:ABC-2 type transport system ATP-binding protein|nr:ABC transporter ATP-binding protein [Eubacteriaceae bacterium]